MDNNLILSNLELIHIHIVNLIENTIALHTLVTQINSVTRLCVITGKL